MAKPAAARPPAPGSTARAAHDALAEYRARRDFARSPEPAGEVGVSTAGELAYVVQKHAATRLHYDLRLELDGVMLSWAVPKGPSVDPRDKRIAVRTEDHPIAYNTFEGTIPKGQYGAGRVIVWDRGRWEPVGDPRTGLRDGKLLFRLHGQKLAGLWELVRIGKPGERQVSWILFKKHDAYERPREQYDVITALPDSVVAHPLPPASRVPSSGPAPADTAATADDAAPPRHASALPGARPAPLPQAIAPQLATAATGVPPRGDWCFEIKFDGYRLMARIDARGQVTLVTRGGHDWTARMPALARELAALGWRNAWLDGEIVVLGAHGLPEFNALQQAFDGRAADAITYFVFDAPFIDGHDLRAVPLRERRRFLQARLAAGLGARVRWSAEFHADAPTIVESARQLGLEGVIAKRADAPYVSARTETWLKLKCRQRQEFVVVGYTDRGGDAATAEVGSLLLAVYDDAGALQHAGGVGTGWSARAAADLKARLAPLRTDAPAAALDGLPTPGRWSRRELESVRWVRPEVVVEVAFADWTPDGHVRHATWLGLRADKPAAEVRREATAASTAIRVTHPSRVVDAASGLTKLDVVRYYESVAERMLPHLAGRPVSLVRAPDGLAGPVFFQKHDEALSIPGLRQLPKRTWPDHERLLEVPTARAIAEAAQMNVLEFHTWNATAARIGKPDRMVFDLDPGDGVAWAAVQEAALLVRSLLTDLGLQSWLKTSGGKGLHVVVPLLPRDDWDAVKAVSQAIVQHLARVIPSRFVAVSGARNRVGRIYVDFLRNAHGATTAAAFSVRARPGLGVSMPVPWDALPSLKGGDHWTVATARDHLSFEREDPWAAYATTRQTLTQARRRLVMDAA